MIPIVEKLTPAQWAPLSENAHLVVFGRHKPASLDRIDFALLARKESKTIDYGMRQNLLAYVTCRELDADTLYWQFGGSFPGTLGTVSSKTCMEAFLAWSREHYKRVSFLVENTNAPMLKMGLFFGFKIVGIRTFEGSVLVEHLKEFHHV